MEKRGLLGKILLGSIPAGLAGLLFNDIVEKDLRDPLIICTTLLSVGLIMLAAEKMFKFKGIDEMGIRDVLFIGFAQALAIIPGVSRSGITISAGLFRGFDREEAARFSFLLATPVLAGATVLHAGKVWENPELYDYKIFLSGFVTSCVMGFIAIKFLLSFLRRHPMNIFVYYRFVLSIVIISGIWLKG
jgi:undecaprenyl-diphosphatase